MLNERCYEIPNPGYKVTRLPNLFAGSLKTKDSRRLYEMFLIRLSAAGQSNRMLAACRDIRRMARQAAKPNVAAFTYHWEMEAHGQKHNFEAMWRTLKAGEKANTGETFNIRTHQWIPKEHHQLIFQYVPLMYLRGRYQLGCKLMETALKMTSHRKNWSFECLWHVYKPLSKPSSIYDVTLAHFYAALGRDLSEWALWGKFLDGFDPKLFRSSGVTKEALRQNSRLMKPFFEWITTERRKRLFSGTAYGERDLVESPSKVRSRQTARKQQLLKLDAVLDIFEQKLLQLFPELAELPGLPSFKELLRSKKS